MLETPSPNLTIRVVELPNMAELIIPAPDPNGYWHFTYRTTDSLDGRWYGGKRSTKKHPLADRYLGSGNWIRKHPDRKRLKCEIVAFFASSSEVFAAEALLVTWNKVFDDPLCMNMRDGGEGVSAEAALLRYTDPVQRANNHAMLRRIQSDPKVQAKMHTSALLRFQDPEELARQTAHMRRITSDPVILAKARVTRETPTWRANVIAAAKRLHVDPAWQEAHAASICRMVADPKWQSAQAAKNKRMATDPRWRENATARLQQARAIQAAKRGVIYIVLRGKKVPLRDACRKAGASYENALYRRKRGWPQSQWLIPPHTRKRTAR